MGIPEVQCHCQVRRKLAGMLQMKMLACVKMHGGGRVETALGNSLYNQKLQPNC